jgi:hypothetical protein
VFVRRAQVDQSSKLREATEEISELKEKLAVANNLMEVSDIELKKLKASTAESYALGFASGFNTGLASANNTNTN